MDSNGILVIGMMVSFIGLLFTGYPIAFILGGVAMLFTLIGYCSDLFLGTITGLDYMTIGLVVNRLYKVMYNWILIALPMFIFMGLMLDRSGIAEKMMIAMQGLFGKIRGGLAVSVTLIGILLAAATGIIGASVVLLGLLSLPAMLSQGYAKPLTVGTVCASGTLGILIPPSIMLVMMADQLSLAVGDLFMGALLPGILLGILIGATCFALVLRELGGDEFIAGLFTGLPFGPHGIILAVLGMVFFLGFFLDWIEITLIILPILSPVITGLGFNISGHGVIDNPELVWFAILVAISLQTSFLTPPVGFAIFYLKGVSPPEIKLVDIYKGVIPFIILQLAGLLIVMVFPWLVTWLPSMAYG